MLPQACGGGGPVSPEYGDRRAVPPGEPVWGGWRRLLFPRPAGPPAHLEADLLPVWHRGRHGAADHAADEVLCGHCHLDSCSRCGPRISRWNRILLVGTVSGSSQTSFIRTDWFPLKCVRIVNHADYRIIVNRKCSKRLPGSVFGLWGIRIKEARINEFWLYFQTLGGGWGSV